MRHYIRENWPIISLLVSIIFVAGISYNKLNSLDERVGRLENYIIKPQVVAQK